MQTTTNFAPHGVSSPHIPYFVDQANMNIVRVPTLWTVYIATIPGRTRRPNTWLAYARNLLLWLNVCGENGWDWAAASEEHIAAWRNHLLAGRSDRTQRRYARSTVISYIRTVCDFYEWAHKRGHIAQNPVRLIPKAFSRSADGLLAHHGPNPDHLTKKVLVPQAAPERLPYFFTVEQRKRILASLDARARLQVRWALYTGIRIHELAALELSQIPKVGGYTPGRLYKMTLTTTKAGKDRTLFVPSFLLDETQHYVRYVRRSVVLASRRRVGSFAGTALWLGRWGTRVSTSAIRSDFRRGLETAGLTEGRFHDLRHTYAITMLDKLMQDSPDPKSRSREPLKALKRLLGHSSITSTEIYLRAREEYLDDIEPDDFELPGLVRSL